MKKQNRPNVVSDRKKDHEKTVSLRHTPTTVHISKAAMDIARDDLKKFEVQSDEAFLVRAQINRKLSFL
jgi:hypothetical protein